MDELITEGLSKSYGGRSMALQDVSFSAPSSGIFALIGRNGAGKTTLVRILATELAPTSGRASINGIDVVREDKRLRERIAIVPQEARTISWMTPKQATLTYLMWRGFGYSEAKKRAEESLARLKLDKFADTLNRSLSGGTKRKALAAMVLASEEVAKRYTDDPVWIDGVGWNVDTQYWTDRDLCYPEYLERAARMAYKMAKIEDPRRELDFAEVYDPFDYKELHHMEGLMLAGRGEAPKLTKEGVTQRDGDFPVNPSGGLLGVGNPIAAAGLMKACEVFWQLRGEAGKRQVKKDVNRGLAQAWGDLMQVGTVITMRR